MCARAGELLTNSAEGAPLVAQPAGQSFTGGFSDSRSVSRSGAARHRRNWRAMLAKSGQSYYAFGAGRNATYDALEPFTPTPACGP
jgi:hypothetical protein